MKISRRQFFKFCGSAAAALGLGTTEVGLLGRALANPRGPTVIWLQGSGCYGCSISFLNRISDQAPHTAADVLLDVINLAYHPALMGAAGDQATALAADAADQGEFILVVEGGVPTSFTGHACGAWTADGKEVTFEQAIRDLTARAKAVVCVGTCASFGGIPAAPPNPTGVVGVKALTGCATINIPGCPPNPDWIVWTIAQLLIGQTIALDADSRPRQLYGKVVHASCTRRESPMAATIGHDGQCLKELGCRGLKTRSPCPGGLFNGGRNWCIGANAPCIGCTEKEFPGTDRFFKKDYL